MPLLGRLQQCQGCRRLRGHSMALCVLGLCRASSPQAQGVDGRLFMQHCFNNALLMILSACSQRLYIRPLHQNRMCSKSFASPEVRTWYRARWCPTTP